MKRNKLLGGLLGLLMVVSGCNSQPANIQFPQDSLPIRIQRFDEALLHLIETNDTSLEKDLLASYPAMLDISGKGILNLQSPAVPGFFDRIINYYSEPTLKKLYEDAVSYYKEVSDIEEQLGRGFAFLKANFPTMQIPAIYMHVSGFSQNVLAGDSLLSLSIDRYLGTDYPLYLQFFQDYQRIKMQRILVASDYLTGWLMSEFPFTGNENVLLERMVYEGKIKYIVSLALPEVKPYQLGLDGNQIYLSYRIHISDIFSDFAEEIQKNITDMAFKADEMDNYLADTFGCEFSEYAKKDAI